MPCKTPLDVLPYAVVYSHPWHLLTELQHRGWWPIRTLNYGLNASGEERKFRLNELEEIRKEAYENTQMSKGRAKIFHDNCINREEFYLGKKVYLYDSGLHLFPRELRSRWTDIVVVRVFPHGAIEIKDPSKDHTSKVNRQ